MPSGRMNSPAILFSRTKIFSESKICLLLCRRRSPKIASQSDKLHQSFFFFLKLASPIVDLESRLQFQEGNIKCWNVFFVDNSMLERCVSYNAKVPPPGRGRSIVYCPRH